MSYAARAFRSEWLLLASALLFALAVLGAGCVGPTPIGDESAAEVAVPLLTFNADWTITQSGPLVGGQPASIRYAIDRLPNCRAQYHGGPAWGIVASWAADGGFASSAGVVQYQNGVNVPVDATFTVPFGRDLAVWFFNSDEFGCTGYDSDYGRNFHFAIGAPADPVIHFRSDWSDPVDGALRSGGAFLVDYDLLRLPWCRADYNGYQTWEVTAHARFDDGTTQDLPVTQVVGFNGRGAAPARFTAPAGAHAVDLWFENTDRTGCRAWDSNYSRNYRFALP